MKRRCPEFTVFGSFDGANVGDVAVLACLMKDLKGAYGAAEVHVPTRNPQWFSGHLAPYAVRGANPVSIRLRHGAYSFLATQVVRAALTSEALITTANMLFDNRLLSPYDNLMLSFFVVAAMYRRLRPKGRVLGIGISVNPPTTRLGAVVLRRALEQHDTLLVRDASSARVVRGLGVRRPSVVLCPDLCVGRSSDEFGEVPLRRDGPRAVALNLSRYCGAELQRVDRVLANEWERFFASLAGDIKRHVGADILLVPTTAGDEALAERVCRVSDAPVAMILPSRTGLCGIAGVLASQSTCVAMRMHAAILSLNAGVPTIGLTFTSKLSNFYEDYGLTSLSAKPGARPVDTYREEVLGQVEEALRLKQGQRESYREAMLAAASRRRDVFARVFGKRHQEVSEA